MICSQSVACQVSWPYREENSTHRTSEGLADQEYCAKMEQEVPVTAQYLLDRELVHASLLEYPC